jgi:hypothetical protein
MNEQLKPYKTVEEIAKKHRLEISFIQKQLDMGAPIEHEHTKNQKLATEIALQHLDEIPDYYTRLKKMEIQAKKHHKKFKDIKEHCGCEDNAVKELESGLKKLNDTSYDSIDFLMRRIMKKHDMTAKQLHNVFVDKNNKTPDTWIKDIKESIFEGRRDDKRAGDPGYSLRDWFKGGGWIQVAGKYKGKPCAKQPGQTTKPFCRDADDAAAMSKAEKQRRTVKKRAEDPNPERKGKAKMVREETCPVCGYNPCQCLEGSLQEKKDACYDKVKSRYKVWPSAYASGALVKCRKVGAKNWGTKSEEVKMIRYCPKCKKDETRDECKYGAKYWDMFSIPSTLTPNQLKYNIATVHPGNFPESYDHEYSMARSELSTIISAAKRLKKKVKGEGNIEAWVQSKITKAADYIDAAADYIDSGQGKVDEECWDGYEQQGMKKKGNKVVPNCVKKEGYSNWKEEIKLVEGWPFGPNTVTPQNSPSGTKSVEVGKKYPALQNGQMSNVTYDEKGNKSVKPMTNMERGAAALRMRNIGMSSMSPGMNQYQSYEPEGDLVEYSNWREEINLSEDWQSVNRKDNTDGLSQKAVDAYRRENPGSKLQTAVTEKNPTGKRAGRRKNFCSRMKGMKSKLTSAKTARDPDSRINKALRRWNCN